MKKLLLLAGLGLLSQMTFAQEFEANLELRPQFEYRHGYKILFPDNAEAAAFISQRSRINFQYQSEKLNTYLSLQNVRVWGDVNTLTTADKNGTAIHEAWASLIVDPQFALKMGRQEIIYDDSRIFGNVDWAQAGRSHDALVATFKPNLNNRIDLGLALNAEDETLLKEDYNVKNYKSFQYLWYHTHFKDINLSLLALNTGFAFEKNTKQEVAYNQTLGGFITYGKNNLNMDASAYLQTGKIEEVNLNAYNLAGNIHYQLDSSFNLGLGVELLSGTDMDASTSEINSFNPLFGTNHKFNGWMDYFYVGTHINSVGLLDVNLPLKYQQNKWTLQLVPHVFSSAAKVVDGSGKTQDNYLGTEIDFSLGYKIADNINFQIGYSHMLASSTMEILKGGNSENTNNWAWAQFVFKPKLFTYSNNN